MGELFDETMPMGYEELLRSVQKLRHRYKFVQRFSIGRSVLGRKIPAIIIGTGSHPVLYVGTHHALEYLTSMVLMKFAGELCAHIESGEKFHGRCVKSVMTRQCVYIIPMLNPDGVELHLNGASSAYGMKEKLLRISGGSFENWQANARGVDLNHNYNAGFKTLRRMEIDSGITGPAPRQFGGYRPESEPETHALCNLCRRMLFRRAYAFHSQGEEIYWEYGDRTPKNSLSMAQSLADASGYSVSQQQGLASHGGFKDWYINVFAKPGFTIEIGRGKNPLPPDNLNEVYEKLEKMLVLGLVL
ncbi:MAG TPA: M14 family metallocarboxypeptidase [Ruminiclostridium sp.]|nr:M14 family metallocarboxypeptidase [Ruminiclostridium sp.]